MDFLLTNQNSIQEEIKCRLKAGNSCYYSVQTLLSSRLLPKNLKIKIYKTIILPAVLYGCETWSLTLREESRLRVFENRIMRRIFGPKKDENVGVEIFLSSRLHSKNLKIKIYKTIILPVVLYGCETWSLTLREESRLRVFENRILMRIFGPKRENGEKERHSNLARVRNRMEVRYDLKIITRLTCRK